jgi:hypothetical protein
VIFWPLGYELWHGNGHPATTTALVLAKTIRQLIMGYENVAFWQ